MKHPIILLLTAFIFSSCSKHKEEKVSYSDSIVKNFTQWDDKDFKKPQLVLDPEKEALVHLLSTDTIVPTQRYANAFNELKQQASQDELILLTSHKNPTIRCHAYTALIDEGYPAIHRICFEHFNDTLQKVTARVRGGMYPLSVRTWMIYALRPGSGSKYSFERKLYRRYMYEYNDLSRAMKGLNI